MFDVEPNDIAQLNDTDLRELVGRLCEAELTSRGLSSAGVTWGGNQTAADGGLDVRVALPAGTEISGFIPRIATGFQVKTPDMPRAAILDEMRPNGAIRTAIRDLAEEAGAYIIISSHGSTADSALRNRKAALQDALEGIADAHRLYTDFYDRTRMASWVRQHAGLIAWVRRKVGRGLNGWQPYGPWTGAAESVDAEYLLDGKLKLRIDQSGSTPSQIMADTIDELRDKLRHPGGIVRLVGLSGVGKTRLVQALFDDRIGTRPLPPSLAIYTNLSDNPEPQPVGLASDLIANGRRAIVIVDNCAPDLHRRLSELCHNSTVSIISIEYDIRDDQPEGTQVVVLYSSSYDLIIKLLERRYKYLSSVDVNRIAEISGGNPRIAIALAETVGRSDTISSLSNEELFNRLFHQRHSFNNELLRAAQVCSLVYSFQGEKLSGEAAEIPRLSVLADQAPQTLYRHISELHRRDLIQQRGEWRAVLPHAIANRLAARALEDIPHDLIDHQLVTNGTERLARSFSRRLSFLHESARAVAIVERWLERGGLLGEVTTFRGIRQAMFENVAPVSPTATLRALERAAESNPTVAAATWQRFPSLLRSLAYESDLFSRATAMLVQAAVHGDSEQATKETRNAFTSLFTIYLSGTHAPIKLRLELIEHLFRQCDVREQSLGMEALNEVLRTSHFVPVHHFEFGARSRDYGFMPKDIGEVTHWYRASLALVERFAFEERILVPELRDLIAYHFRGLCAFSPVADELVHLARRFAADGFWLKGWIACRQTIRFDGERLSQELSWRLHKLEAELKPGNLSDQVRAIVLGDRLGNFDLADLDDQDGDEYLTRYERLEAIAQELGVAMAQDDNALTKLIPDLLQGGHRVWAFGRGLAQASANRKATWSRLVACLSQIAPDQRSVSLLQGYLAELWETERDLAQNLLDDALRQPDLVAFTPVLHSAVQLDSRGVARLKQGLSSGEVPVRMYQALAGGRTTDELPGDVLKDLLHLITEEIGGFDVALDILYMRIWSDRSAGRDLPHELIDAGQALLLHIPFSKGNQRRDHHFAGVARACLKELGAGQAAAELAKRLKHAVAAYETSAYDVDNLLEALLEVQPIFVLDALFEGDQRERSKGFRLFAYRFDDRSNPANGITCEALLNWCDRNPKERYPIAAAIVTFARPTEEAGPKVWSAQAVALLTHSPDLGDVLSVFVSRFQPTSWSGSRAAIMEANLGLLDHLPDGIETPELARLIYDQKARLEREIASERELEDRRDRDRDERFE